MDQGDVNASEEVYKQNLLQTASTPRIALLLYSRMLLTLRQIELPSPMIQWKRQIQTVHQMLTHLMTLFSSTQDPIYVKLCQDHDFLAQKISQIFSQNQLQASHLQALIVQLEAFESAWKQHLQIKPRQPIPRTNLNIRRYTHPGPPSQQDTHTK